MDNTRLSPQQLARIQRRMDIVVAYLETRDRPNDRDALLAAYAMSTL